tara:strand:+ start:829 stop:1914 length:1086 start_codon:yes stop_codon:yes gene_type:complete
MKKKILIIVGTRPNFIKVTQFKKEVESFPNLEVLIAHTGQHFDDNMSNVFFEQFQLVPDFFMEVGRDSVCKQIGEIISKMDEIVDDIKPNMIIAVGDVNSTLCASIVANKRGITLGHLESGLRSLDRSMPEEINRILTDEITDHFFVTEQSGIDNLKADGKSDEVIHFVGNTMIDTLVAFEEKIKASPILDDLKIQNQEFILLTMHRPSNVDDSESLLNVIDLVEKLSKIQKVVFPVHPRTINNLKKNGLLARFEAIENLIQLPPLDYFGFQNLIANASVVITDSGGIQEETTFKQVPCITIRDNTERPSTIDLGTNELMAFDVDTIVEKVNQSNFKKGSIPPHWDGKSTARILKIINQIL